MEKVRIDDNGFINKSSNCKQREGKHAKETHDEHENFTSHSHTIADVATMVGVKPIMSNNGQKQFNTFRNGEFNRTDESPKPDYDSRCHPFWYKND